MNAAANRMLFVRMNRARTEDRFRYLGEVQGPDRPGVTVLQSSCCWRLLQGFPAWGVVSHRCLTVSLSVHSGLVDMCLETGLARRYQDMRHRDSVPLWVQWTFYCITCVRYRYGNDAWETELSRCCPAGQTVGIKQSGRPRGFCSVCPLRGA